MGSGKILSSRWSRGASWTGLWYGGAAESLTGGAGVPFVAELGVGVRLGSLVAALAFRIGSRRPWGCNLRNSAADLGVRARCKHGGNHGRGSRAVDGARGNRISA